MMRTARKTAGLATAFGALAVVLAACGGGVNSASSSSEAAASAPAASAAASGAASAAGSAEAAGSAAAAVPCGDWGVAMHNWVGYTASAEVLTQVAKEKLGCNITQTKLDEANVTYDAMEAGSVDVIIEDWGGGRWQEWVDRGAIKEVGSDGNVGLIGMYVPKWMAEEYPDITDGTNLNKYAEMFKTAESGDKGAWYEGPPGYTTIGQKIIDAYGLDFKAINVGSEQALIDLMEKGQKDKKAVLAYFWEPHYYLANQSVARVNFPESDWTDAKEASGKTDYPKTDLIKLATTKLMESGSPFATLVTNWQWTNDDQNSVALDIQNGATPAEAAKKWIDANPDKVAAWLQGTGAA
jgi:glycine betaine/proline transport system substrate-binding protein